MVATEYDKQFADLYLHWNAELGADPNVAICICQHTRGLTTH